MELGYCRPLLTSREYFAQQMVIIGFQCHCLVVMEHVVIRVIKAIEHGKSWHDKPSGWLVIKNVLP